jgi:hypothetical protein
VHHRLVVLGAAAGLGDTGRGDAVLGIALDTVDRVDDQVAGQPVANDRHAHRVDQERHVVAGEVDDGVGRLPAVLLDLRVVDVQLRRAALASAQQVEVGQRRTVQVGGIALGEVGGRGARVVVADEVAEQLAFVFGDLLVDQLEQALDDPLVLLHEALGHGDDLGGGAGAKCDKPSRPPGHPPAAPAVIIAALPHDGAADAVRKP